MILENSRYFEMNIKLESIKGLSTLGTSMEICLFLSLEQKLEYLSQVVSLSKATEYWMK